MHMHTGKLLVFFSFASIQFSFLDQDKVLINLFLELYWVISKHFALSTNDFMVNILPYFRKITFIITF